MAPFVLRRLKSEVLGSLPPKTEETLRIALPASQKALYAATVRRIAAQARARHGVELRAVEEALVERVRPRGRAPVHVLEAAEEGAQVRAGDVRQARSDLPVGWPQRNLEC